MGYDMFSGGSNGSYGPSPRETPQSAPGSFPSPPTSPVSPAAPSWPVQPTQPPAQFPADPGYHPYGNYNRNFRDGRRPPSFRPSALPWHIIVPILSFVAVLILLWIKRDVISEFMNLLLNWSVTLIVVFLILYFIIRRLFGPWR